MSGSRKSEVCAARKVASRALMPFARSDLPLAASIAVSRSVSWIMLMDSKEQVILRELQGETFFMILSV